MLRYTEGVCFTNDGGIVFSVLAKYNATIIKTIRLFCFGKPKVLFSVDSVQTLNKIITEINSESSYEVSVVRTYKQA